jgi:hypothetical protein
MRALIALVAGLAISLSADCVSQDKAVLDREIEFVTAMQAKDMTALEQLMAPDFRLTLEEIPPFALTVDQGNPSPGLPGWRWRANLASMSFGRIELAGVETISLAEDMVAINMTMTLEEWTARGPAGTQDNSGTYDLTDIWLNRDGTWRIISRYSRLRQDAERQEPDFVLDN